MGKPLPSVDALIDSVLAGDRAAWQGLVDRVHPMVVLLCRQHPPVAGSSATDSAREVAVRTLEQLHRDGHAALRQYASVRERYPEVDSEKSFRRWLKTVAYHSYVDWLRSQPEYQRRRTEEGARALRRVQLVSLEACGDQAHPTSGDVTTGVEIRRILELVCADSFPVDQRRVLHLWLMGYTAEELSAAMDLSGPAEARQLLQNARQRLRRQVHRAPSARPRACDQGGKS